MPENGQTHFKILQQMLQDFYLKYVWPFWDIMH